MFQVGNKYYKKGCIGIKSVIFSVTKNKASRVLASVLFCTLSVNASNVRTYSDVESSVESVKKGNEVIDPAVSSNESNNSHISSDSENKDETQSKSNAKEIVNDDKMKNDKTKVQKKSEEKKKTVENKNEKGKKNDKQPKVPSKNDKEKEKKEKKTKGKGSTKSDQKVDTQKNKAKVENNTISCNGKTYKIMKTVSGTATAYSDHGLTSTGCMVRNGVIAVDPKVIPYYSHLLLEFEDGSFFEGDALDTGGALRSHYKNVVADIYIPSETSCRQFGRRNVKVHVCI